MAEMTLEEAKKWQQRRLVWWNHPEIFFEDALGITAYDRQIEIAHSVRDNRTTTVASCNSAGKTGISGCIVPWFLLCHTSSIVVTTAPKWQQIKDLLWREINTRWEKAKFPLSSAAPNVVSWEIRKNWYAVGVASKDPTKVQGYHADSGWLLAIGDEAAGIEELLFEGLDAIMTSENCRMLLLGNPTSQSGTFRESHKPSYPSNKIKISAFDTPNLIANNLKDEDDLVRAIESKRELLKPYPSLVSPIWVYERIKKWGIESPMYQARVRANFPEVGENNLIPLSQLEAACSNERLDRILGLNLVYGDDSQEKQNEKIRQEKLDEYIANQNLARGVDVARFGSDSTVLTPRWGKIIGRQSVRHKMDTMQTAGVVWSLISNRPTDFTGVDVIGVGAGVVDRLHELQEEQRALGVEQWAQVFGVNVADKPSEKPEGMPQMVFANKRAELYWKVRGLFETGDIYLMPDENGHPPEDLMYELSSIQYKYLGGKIYIEEKAEMKKRLLRSPDRADSLILSEGVGNGATWSVTDETVESEDDDWEPPTRDQEDDGWSDAGVSADDY